jgi:hypothetical protein
LPLAIPRKFMHRGQATVGQGVTSMSHSNSLQHQKEGKMTLAGHLAELSEKHRLLEMRIQEELARPGADDLQISRLKKEKLKIKDEMAKLKNNSQH